jgi:hypothetical protein
MTVDQGRRLRLLAFWHRCVALTVCAWLIVLAISGMLVNHANDWGLDRRPLAAALQRLLYGFDAAGENFCDRPAVPEPDCAAVFARLNLPGGELLLSGKLLFLLDGQGRLLEKFTSAQLGLGQLEAGLAEGAVVFLRDDRRTVRSDAELLEWQVLDARAAGELAGRDWQADDRKAVAITWERMLLDLHAGRFLGPLLAKAFTDLMGALLLLLALSGFWLWWMKRTRG